jgi:hypothetical protein
MSAEPHALTTADKQSNNTPMQDHSEVSTDLLGAAGDNGRKIVTQEQAGQVHSVMIVWEHHSPILKLFVYYSVLLLQYTRGKLLSKCEECYLLW